MVVSALAQPCSALPSPTASVKPLCSDCDALSLSASPSVFLSVRACSRSLVCVQVREVHAPPPAHPTKQYQIDIKTAWPATSAVRGAVDYCASVRALHLYRCTVPWLTYSIRTAKRRVVDQSGRNIIASRDSREVILATCLSPLRLHLPHFFRTLLHLAAPAPGPRACTRTFCSLPPAHCTLHLATQRRLSNRGPMSLPSTLPKILACIYEYGVQHGTALQQYAQYGCSV